jgi:cytoskeletal protein CcmA (bactofilin family)
MPRKKLRFPSYTTFIGKGTEVIGEVRFSGGLHVEGRVVGDVTGDPKQASGITLGSGGVIEGNLDVAYAVLGGTVIGDVRANGRADLTDGARIEGTLYYGVLELDEGAEVNGKLVHIDDAGPLRLSHQDVTRTEERMPGTEGALAEQDSAPAPNQGGEGPT